MFRYSREMELVFGKNYVGVEVGEEYLHGYLAVRQDHLRLSTCISWLPLEDIVARNVTEAPPGGGSQREIVVFAHNLATIELRPIPEGSERFKPGRGQPFVVTLIGVDRTKLVELNFEAGGADGFVDALRLDAGLTLEDSSGGGDASTPAGDHTASGPHQFTVHHTTAQRGVSGGDQRPHPATLCDPPCPRCYLLQEDLGAATRGGATGGEFTTLSKRASPLPRSHLRYHPSRAGRFGDGVRRALGFLPKSSKLNPQEMDARVEEYYERRRLKTLQQCLVGWRLCVYRQRKLEKAIDSLLTREDQPMLPNVPYPATMPAPAQAHTPTPTTPERPAVAEDVFSSPEPSLTPFHTPMAATPLSPVSAAQAADALLATASPRVIKHCTGSVAGEGDSMDTGTPMSRREFDALLDTQGRLSNLEEVAIATFSRGCEHELRGQLWLYLIGIYSRDMTADQKAAVDVNMARAYEKARRHVTERREAGLSERELEFFEVIELDVQRSDRLYWAFDGESANFEALEHCLEAWVLANPQYGYAQGMNDLLEPIMYTMSDVPKAYACFCHLMTRSATRFDRVSERGIQVDLQRLRNLLQFEDPELASAIRSMDADHFYFAYRWFLLDFKREFQREEVLLVWDLVWAARITVSAHLPVFLAFSVLQIHRDSVLRCRDFAEVLHFFNRLELSDACSKVLASTRRAVRSVYSQRHQHLDLTP